jgi:ferredoxin--NADP+ reductase
MFNATLIDRIDHTDSLAIFRVKPDEKVVPFSAGQYIALGLPVEAKRADYLPSEEKTPEVKGFIKRSYSLASSPNQNEYYEFYVAILPQGQLTSRLAALKVGDRLFIGKKPVGTFTAEPIPVGSNIYAFSTGTGIAPFIAMLRSDNFLDKYNSFTLMQGVRYDTDFGYTSELLKLKNQNSKFNYLPIVSRESKEWQGARGYVQDFVKKGIINLSSSTDHIMLCGNPAMISDIEAMLGEKGFTEHTKKTPGNLHVEKYW